MLSTYLYYNQEGTFFTKNIYSHAYKSVYEIFFINGELVPLWGIVTPVNNYMSNYPNFAFLQFLTP